jgi:hypothetical protein
MANSPILDITYLVDEQDQAEVKVNELINRLESMAIMTIQDRDLTAPPGTPLQGGVWIPAATASGDWTGHEDELAIYYDGWTFLAPVSGMIAYVDDEDTWLAYSNSHWHDLVLHGEYFDALNILDRDLTAPPGGESNGDTYIVGSSATGDWTGHDGEIAAYSDTEWHFRSPRGGMVAFIIDEKEWFGYSSEESEWHPLQDGYGTAERWTGRYSYGGNKLYEKTVSFGALPNATTSTTVHSITALRISDTIRASGWAEGASDSFEIPNREIGIKITNTNISITTDANLSNWDGFVRLEYTRA